MKIVEEYDIFKSFLVKDCIYDNEEEIPFIKTSNLLPNRIITFSQSLKTKDYDQWVAFYEYDYKFIRLWKNPKRYIKHLSKFKGVISPDFSLYRNMPLVMQKWSCYMNHALANYFVNNMLEVIPNCRWGDERTYNFCFSAIEKNKTVAVGAIGGNKKAIDKEYFYKGFEKMIEVLKPINVIVYGNISKDLIDKYPNINFIIFESQTYKYRGGK